MARIGIRTARIPSGGAERELDRPCFKTCRRCRGSKWPRQRVLMKTRRNAKIEQRLGERRRRRSAMQKSTLRCIALGSPGKASSSSRIRRPRRRF